MSEHECKQEAVIQIIHEDRKEIKKDLKDLSSKMDANFASVQTSIQGLYEWKWQRSGIVIAINAIMSIILFGITIYVSFQKINALPQAQAQTIEYKKR